MSIAERFMELARNRLPKEQFDEIYSLSIEKERKAIIYKKEEKSKVIRPHVVERMEDRYDIKLTAGDLKSLQRLILEGGPNIKCERKQMQMISNYNIAFKGTNIRVVFNESTKILITALPPKKTKKRKGITHQNRRKDA